MSFKIDNYTLTANDIVDIRMRCTSSNTRILTFYNVNLVCMGCCTNY